MTNYNEIQTYNNTRRTLFSVANDSKRGFLVAYEWMDKTYKNKLSPQGYIGLMAELKFYEKHKKEFKLTVAADVGDHVDFAGYYNNEMTRFDVTTNLSFKQFESYEPFLGDGIKYKIVVCDSEDFSITNILDISFNRCGCGGYKIPFVLLLPANRDEDGCYTCVNNQCEMEICTTCHNFSELARFSHFGLPSPNEFVLDLPDYCDKDLVKLKYSADVYRYFKNEYKKNIMAVAEQTYQITGLKGEGFHMFNFRFKHNFVKNIIPVDIDCGLII